MNRFESIYQQSLWAKGTGVLSGSGSTVSACRPVAEWIANRKPRFILDLGCGDMEWISTIPAIRSREIAYMGIDVVPTIIAHHMRVFPWFTGECSSILDMNHDAGADMVICKDVLFHLDTETAIKTLEKIESFPSWEILVITSHPGADNSKRGNPSGGGMARFDVAATGIMTGRQIAAIPRPDGGIVMIIERITSKPE